MDQQGVYEGGDVLFGYLDIVNADKWIKYERKRDHRRKPTYR
jgi:hypothetical protein